MVIKLIMQNTSGNKFQEEEIMSVMFLKQKSMPYAKGTGGKPMFLDGSEQVEDSVR